MFHTAHRSAPLVVPAYAARVVADGRILAMGQEALSMLGREPGNIETMRLLEEGGPADLELCTGLFRFGTRQAARQRRLLRPRVLIAVRSHGPIHAPVKEMALKGGAREVYLIEHGMATAIGMGLEVEKPELKAVLSVSEDWFEFSVISLAGALTSTTGPIGVRTLIEDARNHLRLTKSFVPEADALRASFLSHGIEPGIPLKLPGWEAWLGRTEVGRLGSLEVASDALAVGVMPSLVRMTERIKSSVQALSPDRQAQLSRAGVHASGIGMAAPGLPDAVAAQIGFAVSFSPAEFHPSISGAANVLTEMRTLSRALRSTRRQAR